MWNLEKNGIDDLICKAERDTQIQKQIYGYTGVSREWEELGDWDGCMCTSMCKTAMGTCYLAQRVQLSVLC